ncbi:MAG: hypothetical protein P0S95_06270 [Rhabdochlamydiaceae bacterium]|nr:hypothetical protein [Candidatus Amphrikana amoebophyrae]
MFSPANLLNRKPQSTLVVGGSAVAIINEKPIKCSLNQRSIDSNLVLS